MPSHYDGSFGYAGLAPSDEEDAVMTNTKIDVPGMPLATKALRFYIAFRF